MLASVSEECWECDTSIDWISWKGGRSFDLQDLFLTLNRWSLQVESITNPLPAIGFSTADRLSIHHLHSFPFVHRSIEMIKTQISIFCFFLFSFLFLHSVQFLSLLNKKMYIFWFKCGYSWTVSWVLRSSLPCHHLGLNVAQQQKATSIYVLTSQRKGPRDVYFSLM